MKLISVDYSTWLSSRTFAFSLVNLFVSCRHWHNFGLVSRRPDPKGILRSAMWRWCRVRHWLRFGRFRGHTWWRPRIMPYCSL